MENSNIEQQNINIEKNIGKEEEKIAQKPQFYKVLGVMFEVTKKRYYFEVVDDAEYKKEIAAEKKISAHSMDIQKSKTHHS